MRKRNRKLVGTFAMVAFVVVYALFAMGLAEARPVKEGGTMVQTIYFIIMGIAWIFPLMPLITWMERPDQN